MWARRRPRQGVHAFAPVPSIGGSEWRQAGRQAGSAPRKVAPIFWDPVSSTIESSGFECLTSVQDAVLGDLLISTLQSSDWDSIFLPALGLTAWAMCANSSQLGPVARCPHACRSDDGESVDGRLFARAILEFVRSVSSAQRLDTHQRIDNASTAGLIRVFWTSKQDHVLSIVLQSCVVLVHSCIGSAWWVFFYSSGRDTSVPEHRVRMSGFTAASNSNRR